MFHLISSDQYLSVSFYRGSHSSKHKLKTMYFLVSGSDELSTVQYGTVYDGAPSSHPYLETPPNTVKALKGIGNYIMGLGNSHVSQY